MRKFIIKNVPLSKTVTIDSNATTWGGLMDEVSEVHDDVVRPGMKVVLRHNRTELSSESSLPTDMEEVKINLFATKLDAGHDSIR